MAVKGRRGRKGHELKYLDMGCGCDAACINI